MGAAMHQNTEYVQFLRKKHGAQDCWIAFGACIVGGMDFAKSYIEMITITDNVNIDVIKNMLRDSMSATINSQIKMLMIKGAAIHGSLKMDELRNI